MSLLTQEQQETLKRIREAPFDPAASYDYLCTVIGIIDDLQSHHSERKRYTVQELREEFENANNTYRLEKEKFGSRTVYENQHVQTEFEGWVACAKSVGALKAEPDKENLKSFLSSNLGVAYTKEKKTRQELDK